MIDVSRLASANAFYVGELVAQPEPNTIRLVRPVAGASSRGFAWEASTKPAFCQPQPRPAKLNKAPTFDEEAAKEAADAKRQPKSYLTGKADKNDLGFMLGNLFQGK